VELFAGKDISKVLTRSACRTTVMVASRRWEEEMSMQSRRGWRVVAAGVVVSLVTALLPAGPAYAATPGGPFLLYVGYASGLCMSPVTATPPYPIASLQPCLVDPVFTLQRWSLSAEVRFCCGYVYHQLINQQSPSICINTGNSTAKAAAIVYSTCTGRDDEWWTVIPVATSSKGATIYIIANWHSGKCIRPFLGRRTAGTILVQDPCDSEGRHWLNTTNY